MWRFNARLFHCFSFMLIVVFLISGCSSLASKQKGDTGKDYSLFSKLDKKNEKPAEPLYYEFKNILIPGELVEKKDQTAIIKSSGIVSGTMLFNGRVGLGSLVVFFATNMKKDGWHLVSQFKSSFATSLLFYMDKQWCLISISEETYSTDVRVCVAPALYQVEGL